MATKLFTKEAVVHDTLKRLHTRQRGKGTTIDYFRLNEVMSQIAFGGRRRGVYQKIVSLSGVRRGDSVLDVGSSSGYLARKLAAAMGSPGHLTAVDPSEAAIAYAAARTPHHDLHCRHCPRPGPAGCDV